MSKVGMNVTYTPTLAEQPMAGEKPQAALITGWDEETEKATLAVFAEGASSLWIKEGALEGTVVGTFQQPATSPPAGSASAASSSSGTPTEAGKAQTHTTPQATTHKDRQY